MLYHRTTIEKVTDALLYAGLAVVAFTTVYPFVYLLVLSLNETTDAMRGGLYFYPRVFTLENYAYVFENPVLLRAAYNSVLRTVLQTVLSVFLTGMLAYTLSRRDFILRKTFSFMLVLTMYVSGGLIPMYLLIKNLGLINSFWVYIIPSLVGAFHVFIMRTFFEQLPDGLVESGYIDGANDFHIYTRVIFPISLPVIATIALFISVNEWNAWFDNYLYNSRNPDLNVLQYELQKMIQIVEQQVNQESGEEIERSISPTTIKATLTIIVTVPILFVYPFLQKYFVQGMTLGAMKD